MHHQLDAQSETIAAKNARIAALEAELSERREQYAAIGRVLGLISRSRGRLQPVLDAIAETARSLCGSDRAIIWVKEGDALRVLARDGVSADVAGHLDGYQFALGRGSVVGRSIIDRRAVQIADVLSDPESAASLEINRKAGARTVFAVPLLSDQGVIGAIALVRTSVAPFSECQTELIETFANQAVIAIENARLFEAEQTRTKELAESLEYQTAIAEVLAIISRSPADLQPVLEAICAAGARLCDADRAVIHLRVGARLDLAAAHGTRPERQKVLASLDIERNRSSVIGRTVLGRATVHVEQVARDVAGPLEVGVPATVLSVPLSHEGDCVGAITLARDTVRPFSRRHINLIETFAAQAVIAIENARLFEAEQARTREVEAKSAELAQNLAYQTAISQVLAAISRSPGDLQPVLDTIVTTAARLCHADKALIRQRKGDAYALAATYGHTDEFKRIVATVHVRPGRGSVGARVASERCTVHVPDVFEDPDFERHEWQQLGNFRSSVGVPLLRDGDLLGFMLLQRTEVQPFSRAQIELLETFADQAVIAIENARLLDELQTQKKEMSEGLEYQTAISTVLGVINRSKYDLQPTLDTICATAARLCEADKVSMRQQIGEEFKLVAFHNYTDEEIGEVRTFVAPPASVVQQVIAQKRTLHSLPQPPAEVMAQARAVNVRTTLGRAATTGRRVDRRHLTPSIGRSTIFEKADCPRRNLRRPGRHRHRERTVARRAANSTAGAGGKPRIPDRDFGGSRYYRALARQAAVRARCHR